MDGTDVLVGSSISSYWCCPGGQSREHSSPGIPLFWVMRIVPDRSAATLLPIIQQHVRSGTIVHSDECAAYNRIQHLPPVGQHRVVNHSLHFVDPATSVHAPHAESYWNRVKTKFKRMKGVPESMLVSRSQTRVRIWLRETKSMLPSYLDEFMWRERHGSTASTALASLCRDIALRYPV